MQKNKTINKGNKMKYKSRNKSDFRNGKKDTKSVPEDTGRVNQTYLIKEVEKGNDFIWYNKNGNLTEVAASYFLSNPAGRSVGNLNRLNFEEYAIPGIMKIKMLPSFAPTTTNPSQAAVSGLNLAAKQLYAKMRKANAGARSNYEAPDLLIYTLAVTSIYSFLASCARAYGFLSQYPTNNRYFVKPLIEAMGFNYEDLIKNRLQFLNFINTSITRLSRFVIPQGFSIVNRMVWVNSNVFVDTTSTVKGQVYVPSYIGYWKFNSTGMATGGCLSIKYIGSTPRTVEQVIAFFEDLVAPIAQDDDFLTISGDIMKFTESYVSMQSIPVDYIINPIYDENVMLQLHNIDFLTLDNVDSDTSWEVDDLGDFPTDLPNNSTYTVYQKDGLLYFQPIINKVKSPSVAAQLGVYSGVHAADGSVLYIDTPEDSPSVERITEATRLITTYDLVNQTDSALPIDSCGAEIVVGIQIYTNNVVMNNNYGKIVQYLSVNYPAFTNVEHTMICPALMSPFEWDIRITLSADSGDNRYTHWNTRSVGTFDKLSFERLNDIITMSLLTM